MNKKLLIVGMAGAAALLLLRSDTESEAPPEQDEDLMDSAQTTLDEALGAISGATQADGMSTSDAMLYMLRSREKLALTPYNLGDGGWTIGYGHFSKSRANLPDSITPERAEWMFADDVRERGEKWVKLYVTVPLTQNQFDALVSIAFNMSPQSFKKFAAEVNAGNGIDGIAMQSVSWVRTGLQNGIRNRRNAEIAVFNYGNYA